MSWKIDDSKWAAWSEIVVSEGPQALANYPGFHDEGLSGQWEGYRSSRLSGSYRVIYQRREDVLVVEVERVSNHDYSRKR